MPTRVIAGAVVYAKDIAKMSRFYAAVTDLAVIESEPGHVALESHGYQLVIVAMPPDIAARISIAEPPLPRTETPIKPVFFIPSISEARIPVAANGGQMNPPEREWKFQGSRVCDGYDPEGNVFQVREHAV